MVDMLQRYKPTLHFKIVRWKPPEIDWVKCNTDGASKGNPGESAYDFCVRNCAGDLMYAEAQSIGLTTNMEAEIMAVWKALLFCYSKNYHQVNLKTDSLGVHKMISKEWKISWEEVEKTKEIQFLLNNMQVHVIHIFREANHLGDFIANLAINKENRQQFYSFSNLPVTARRLVNVDKQQILSIRVRTKRINSKQNNNA